MVRDTLLTSWFDEHRAFVWGLCYRITGSADDADDVVQETFMRALRHGPERLRDPRRWLTRVAVNAARDVLRRRKRRSYVGPWLPMPIETSDDTWSPESATSAERTPEGGYDLLESVSLAFLEALEALTPTQRAVLLLRDVFDYSAAETGDALDLGAGNVRIIHHRAKRAMDAYGRGRVRATAASHARTRETLERFLGLLRAGDVRGIERLLAADVRAVSDGGGEFAAARAPIIGAAAVARFFSRLAASRASTVRSAFRQVNAFPALVLAFDAPRVRRPPRLVLSADVDALGRMTTVRVIASSRKIARIG